MMNYFKRMLCFYKSLAVSPAEHNPQISGHQKLRFFYIVQLAAFPLHETFLSLLPLADISLSAPSERAIISSPLCLSVSYTG